MKELAEIGGVSAVMWQAGFMVIGAAMLTLSACGFGATTGDRLAFEAACNESRLLGNIVAVAVDQPLYFEGFDANGARIHASCAGACDQAAVRLGSAAAPTGPHPVHFYADATVVRGAEVEMRMGDPEGMRKASFREFRFADGYLTNLNSWVKEEGWHRVDAVERAACENSNWRRDNEGALFLRTPADPGSRYPDWICTRMSPGEPPELGDLIVQQRLHYPVKTGRCSLTGSDFLVRRDGRAVARAREVSQVCPEFSSGATIRHCQPGLSWESFGQSALASSRPTNAAD